jgi:pyridoxamine 5'-phosphate oxidase
MFDAPESDPYSLFARWFAEAQAKEQNDPNAMALATVGADGMPSLRMVLLKGFDPEGFVFYTNYESRKGTQLLAHPKAALLFHWKSLRRQVRVEGTVEPVTAAEADAYFTSRPKQSQIGAWASAQSRPLKSRFELEKQVALHAAKYAIGKVPRPAYWSGFRIKPRYFEFWEDRPFRLHDRVVYEAADGGWQTQRLFP